MAGNESWADDVADRNTGRRLEEESEYIWGGKGVGISLGLNKDDKKYGDSLIWEKDRKD